MNRRVQIRMDELDREIKGLRIVSEEEALELVTRLEAQDEE